MTPDADPAPSYTVAVRELCEFACKHGDLDLRFTPAPSADEGQAGHRVVAQRRGAGHRAELALRAEIGALVVRGRADGWDEARGVLEEVKTYRGDLARMAPNKRALHWAQLQVYGALLCRASNRPRLALHLVYFDVDSQQETVLEQQADAAELEAHLQQLAGRFLAWAQAELAHRRARDAALAQLAFAHAAFRTGQRGLAEQAWKAARGGRCLLAQAGTGIGKTIGTLFPLLKALPGERIDKIWFLTAKSSGHQAPLDALAALGVAAPTRPLRVLQLLARDKACVRPGHACHGESCDLARGFYDRLSAARAAAVQRLRLDGAALRELAQAHAVCPYYLAQELVRWSDVVVADYNYYFDTSALLHGLTLANDWRVVLLIDEAHNLVERGRAMYTAALSRDALRAATRVAPPEAARALRRLRRHWSALTPPHAEPYAVHPEVPAPLLAALRKACAAIDAPLQQPGAALDPALLELHFDLLAFARLAETHGPHSLFDVRIERPGHSELTLRNVVPAPYLEPRFARARAAILFSATLSPPAYYRDMLGLPASTGWIDVEAPFSADQLEVRVVRDISTRYARRAASAAPIARLIAAQYRRRPGNYLAFFSSYDYLEQVLRALAEFEPALPVWAQQRGMSDAEREAFLARYVPEGAGIGFAVLGGSFAEGIDLPGDRLIGAFVATLGLPQLNPVNEQMRRCMQQAFGAGYEYAYLYPGLRKVVQAAGRVVRQPSDRGVLFLIDERYARPEVQRLLPAWWSTRTAPP